MICIVSLPYMSELANCSGKDTPRLQLIVLYLELNLLTPRFAAFFGLLTTLVLDGPFQPLCRQSGGRRDPF
jgi:hypothetical protein